MTSNLPETNYISRRPNQSNFYMPVKDLIKWGSVILALLIACGFYISTLSIIEREDVMLREISSRTHIRVNGKADLIDTWIQEKFNNARHIARSDLIRLYASEVQIVTETGTTMDDIRRSLREQLPYMQQALIDYVRDQEIVFAAIVGKDVQPLMVSSKWQELNDNQTNAVKKVILTREPQVLPIYEVDGKLLMNVFTPVFELGNMGDDADVIAVMFEIIPVTSQLTDLMSKGGLSRIGERSHFMQRVPGGGVELVMLSARSGVRNLSPEFLSRTDLTNKNMEQELPQIASPVDGKKSFMATRNVEGTPFVIVQEFESKRALAPLANYKKSVYVMSVLLIILLFTILIVAVGYMLSARNRHRVRIQEQTMNALVRAVEIRDPYLSGHHLRMARAAVRLGNEMRLPIPERSTLFYAAMLSGLGKIFVPQSILTKKGKLSAEERDILESHISHCMDIIGDMEFDYPIQPVIHQMYERVDGSGYPNKLQDSNINLLSRILGAADAFCAMTMPRSYREALSAKEALKELEDSHKYDKGVLGVLESIADDFEEHAPKKAPAKTMAEPAPKKKAAPKKPAAKKTVKKAELKKAAPKKKPVAKKTTAKKTTTKKK